MIDKQEEPGYHPAGDDNNCVKIKISNMSSQRIDLYLYEFGSPAEMVGFVSAINKASRDDEINIYITNPGGDISAGMQMISTIENNISKNLSLYVQGDQYSMSSIFISRWIGLKLPILVSKDAMLMFHNYSGGLYGKGKEATDMAVNTNKYLQRVFKQNTSPFLTQKEINAIIRDEDVYIYYDEIMERINKIYGKKK